MNDDSPLIWSFGVLFNLFSRVGEPQGRMPAKPNVHVARTCRPKMNQDDTSVFLFRWLH